jgi:hypothetical protein
MKNKLPLFWLTLFLFIATGCASVRFYPTPGLSGKTGLRFYTVKPYLLVELHSEKDNTIKTSVIYLPDLSNPQYLVVKPGFGSNEIKMAFTNSSLNSYGLISESQIPETIDAIAGLISKSSSAAAQIAMQGGDVPQSVTDDNFKLYEIIISPDGTSLKEIKVTEEIKKK